MERHFFEKFDQLYYEELPLQGIWTILQARILVWAAILFTRSFWRRDWTQVSCTAGRFFTNWATREGPAWDKEVQKMTENPDNNKKEDQKERTENLPPTKLDYSLHNFPVRR